MAHLNAHPRYDLGEQPERAYRRFDEAVEKSACFERRTIETGHAVNDRARSRGEDEVIRVTATVSGHFCRSEDAGSDGERAAARVYDPKRDARGLARLYREFDAETGEPIRKQ